MNNFVENDDLLKPWYKQFWPWFIMFLPATAVVAGTITVIIAFKNADSLVADDYYKEGLAINGQFQLQRNAASLGYSAVLKRLPDNRLYLKFDNTAPEAPFLTLRWIHPFESDKDFDMVLRKQADGSFQAKSEQNLTGRWYLRLLKQDEWLIKSEIGKDMDTVHLSPHLD